MRNRRLVLRASFGALILVTGCNAVLDNQVGQLADASLAPNGADTFVPTAPDTAPPPVVVDAAPPTPPLEDAAAPPSAFDAGAIPTCQPGQTLCNGTCVATSDPLFGCGVASCTPCALAHATTTCAGSGCAVAACDPGYADCDQKGTTGCETDLSLPGSCGACNAKCASPAPNCAPTATGFACTSGCPAAAPTLCGNQCVDLATSLDYCGQCTIACPAVPNGQAVCNGHCEFVCQADFHACGSACVSDLSPATCGSSCAPCPTGANAVATCNGAQCGLACQPGYANCNGNPVDGCEVNLGSNPASCGQCGTSCGSGKCSKGICSLPDAGSPPVDSGPPPADAGAPPPDSGSDSSPGAPDAASPARDAAASD